MNDEEKKAIDNMKSLLLYSKEHEYFSPFQEQEIDDMNIVLNLIEKQFKEIEELKEDKYGLEEEVQIQAKNLMLCEDAIKETYTKWIDKIKAEIEELKNMKVDGEVFTTAVNFGIKVLQSLLDKE